MSSTPVPNDLIAKSTEVIEFYTREALLIHALMDRIKVQREVNGEKLSMSQRVSVAVGVVESLVRRLGQEPPETMQ